MGTTTKTRSLVDIVNQTTKECFENSKLFSKSLRVGEDNPVYVSRIFNITINSSDWKPYLEENEAMVSIQAYANVAFDKEGNPHFNPGHPWEKSGPQECEKVQEYYLTLKKVLEKNEAKIRLYGVDAAFIQSFTPMHAEPILNLLVYKE